MKIPDSAAYELLQRYDIPTAKWYLAKNMGEAEVAAENMTFPVILKADSPEIMHKMASGCIRTVYHRDHLRKMFEAVMKSAKSQTKEINGVLMQEFIHSDIENVQEFIIGVKRDEQFGPVIMFGAGGRLTSTKDVCFRLVPIKQADALEMTKEPKISSLVTREDTIADILMKVSKLAEFEKISELDINPLLVSDKGVLAADVRILL